MKPVLYLDIDGVLLDLEGLRQQDPKYGGPPTWIPSYGAKEFLDWSKEHLDVRWLTYWCTGGKLLEGQAMDLAKIFNVDVEYFSSIEGLHWHDGRKINGFFWLEHLVWNRPFVWVEDGLLPEEEHLLDEYGLLDSYYHTDIFDDPHALEKTFEKIKRWYNDL